MSRILKIFKRNDRGISAIEYAFLAVGIGLVIFATISVVGDNLNKTFGNIAKKIS